MYKNLIREIEIRLHKYGEKLQLPATSEQVLRLREEALKRLGSALPEGYISFLKIVNGLDWNGTFFLVTEEMHILNFNDRFVRGFVDWNLLYRDAAEFNDILVFGESGIDIYVYQISST